MAQELTVSGRQRVRADLRVAAVVFAAIAAACWVGIVSRPAGLLASLWPANAIFLGLLLRWPPVGRLLPLMAAASAYLFTDLVTGAGLAQALRLNLANLVSVAVAYAILSRLPAGVRRLRFPLALVWLVLASVAGGASAAIVGALVSPDDFGEPVIGMAIWAVSEAVNYLAVLPAFLTAPGAEFFIRQPRRRRLWRRRDLAPALSVVVSCLLAGLIGGPGAVAVPVLALLWCGMVYPVFPTALLTLFFGTFALSAIAAPMLLTGSPDENRAAVLSLRIGVSVISLMPVLLALLTRARNEMTARLRHLAHHDGLTGIRNRLAFIDSAGVALANARRPMALLLIDLDRFKEVNDTWGHAAGDDVLIETVRRLSRILRASDHFARLGGEEFAILLTDCAPGEAEGIAERLRRAIAASPVCLADGREVAVTISIGMVPIRPPSAETLASTMSLADRCLYRAKAAGRNRVIISPEVGGIEDALPAQASG